MKVKLGDTRLEARRGQVRLLGPDGAVLLELLGSEIEAAIRAGFLDPENLHSSLFEYASIRALPAEGDRDAVERFLRSMEPPAGDAAA